MELPSCFLCTVLYSQQFFLEEIENALKLKRSSNYYYQVHAEMVDHGMQVVSLCCMDRDGHFVEEISFDKRLWHDTVFPKLQSFYLNVIVPEILTCRVQQSVFCNCKHAHAQLCKQSF